MTDLCWIVYLSCFRLAGMTRTIELPESVYTALRETAAASGLTPAAWIAARVGAPVTPASADATAERPAGTLAERFAGRVGQVASGGRESLSQDTGQAFTDHLEAKRRAGGL